MKYNEKTKINAKEKNMRKRRQRDLRRNWTDCEIKSVSCLKKGSYWTNEMAWLQQLARQSYYIQYIFDNMTNLQYWSVASDYTSVRRFWHIQEADSVRIVFPFLTGSALASLFFCANRTEALDSSLLQLSICDANFSCKHSRLRSSVHFSARVSFLTSKATTHSPIWCLER